MSRFLKLILCSVAIAVVAVACEPSSFTTGPAVIDETGEPTVETDQAQSDPAATGCALSAFPGDPDFANLLCEYQAALLSALSSGIIVDPLLTSQVNDAIANYALDPTLARNIVASVLVAIEEQLGATAPLPASPTVSDTTDGAFDCMSRAGELLQEAFQREAIGGVLIPEMDAWEATFDAAAALAEAGDLVGATSIVCDLNLQMEDVLFQS